MGMVCVYVLCVHVCVYVEGGGYKRHKVFVTCKGRVILVYSFGGGGVQI